MSPLSDRLCAESPRPLPDCGFDFSLAVLTVIHVLVRSTYLDHKMDSDMSKV
jgi:hypothetical protein